MTIFLIIIIVLIAVGVIDIFSLILERLRESASSGQDLTTGRSELWKNYVIYFYSHPSKLLFGGGLSVKIPFRLGPHNAYLELILFLGIIGSSLFCITVYNAVAAAWGSPIRGTSVIFLLTLVMYFFLGVYNSPDLQFELLLVLGYLWLNKANDPETVIGKAGDYDRNQKISLNCE
jgi:O-antigen ligase